MRNYLLLFLFFMTIQSQAQLWLEPTARWNITHYSYFIGFMTGEEVGNYKSSEAFVEKDTVVLGQHCQKIAYPEKTFVFFDEQLYYTYKSNDTIYFLIGNSFKPAFYLNVNIGDTVYLPISTSCRPTETSVKFRLDSIGILLKNNDTLQQFFMSPLIKNQPYRFSNIEFITGIGFNCSPYFFDNGCTFDGGDKFTLCNYGDSTISGFWMNPNIQKCVSVGINETENIENNIKLYPNPVSDFLTIESAVKTESILLEDLQGKTILMPDLYNNRVSLFQLNAGIYILKISTPEGIVRKRILKE